MRAPLPFQAGGNTPPGDARPPGTPSSCPAGRGRSCGRAGARGHAARGTRGPAEGRGTPRRRSDTPPSPATPTPAAPPPPLPRTCGWRSWAAWKTLAVWPSKRANRRERGDTGGRDYRRGSALNPVHPRESRSPLKHHRLNCEAGLDHLSRPILDLSQDHLWTLILSQIHPLPPPQTPPPPSPLGACLYYPSCSGSRSPPSLWGPRESWWWSGSRPTPRHSDGFPWPSWWFLPRPRTGCHPPPPPPPPSSSPCHRGSRGHLSLPSSPLGFLWWDLVLCSRTRPPGSRRRGPRRAAKSGSSTCCRLLQRSFQVSHCVPPISSTCEPVQSEPFKGHWASTEREQRHKNSPSQTLPPELLQTFSWNKKSSYMHGGGGAEVWGQACYILVLLEVIGCSRLAPTPTPPLCELQSGSPKTLFNHMWEKACERACYRSDTPPLCRRNMEF